MYRNYVGTLFSILLVNTQPLSDPPKRLWSQVVNHWGRELQFHPNCEKEEMDHRTANLLLHPQNLQLITALYAVCSESCCAAKKGDNLMEEILAVSWLKVCLFRVFHTLLNYQHIRLHFSTGEGHVNGGCGVLPHIISCILVAVYAHIFATSASILGGNDLISSK